MRISLLIVVVVAATLFVNPAKASVVVSVDQVGLDVVATATGSLNTSQLTPTGSASQSGGNISGAPFFVNGLVTLGEWDGGDDNEQVFAALNFSSSPAAPGFTTVEPNVFADINSGPGFRIAGNFFGVRDNYVSGAPLDSSSTWLNKDFVDLELIGGSYVWELTNGETVTVNVNTIPEPTATLFLCGTVALACLRRRRR